MLFVMQSESLVLAWGITALQVLSGGQHPLDMGRGYCLSKDTVTVKPGVPTANNQSRASCK